MVCTSNFRKNAQMNPRLHSGYWNQKAHLECASFSPSTNRAGDSSFRRGAGLQNAQNTGVNKKVGDASRASNSRMFSRPYRHIHFAARFLGVEV
jgi:hypothetical protein